MAVSRKKIAQPSLFDAPPPQPSPAPQGETPENLNFVRKNLHYVLRFMRPAQTMPWHESEAEHWRRFYPQLTALLPEEEGRELLTKFEVEYARLEAATKARFRPR